MLMADADLRLDAMERELAKTQLHTAGRELECGLMRETLRRTLSTAVVLAHVATEVMDGVAVEFHASVEQMANDLNGKGP